MDPLAQALTHYLSEVAGLAVTIEPHAAAQGLPQFLRQRYTLFDLWVEGRRYIVVRPEEETGFKPATLEKQLRQLPLDAEGFCLLAEALPGYVRKRLIERKIPFVIPGSQLYWPALGMAVQPRSGRQRPRTADRLSPATQVVLLHVLTGRVSTPVTPRLLARRLDYSAMTMSRALDEIEVTGLARVTRKGRERLLGLASDRKALWQQARPVMRSPVGKTFGLMESDLPASRRLLAGESALAARSMLVAPAMPVYAVGRDAWGELQHKGVRPILLEEPGTCTVQIWRYDPAPLADAGCVDVFSLYLSLQEETDERLETALDEMMAHYSWS